MKKQLQIMKECAGTQLDTEILEVFCNIPIEELEKCRPINL